MTETVWLKKPKIYTNPALHKKVCWPLFSAVVLLELCEKHRIKVFLECQFPGRRAQKIQRKPGESFQESSPGMVTQLPHQRVKCLPGELLRDPAPRVFTGSWSHRHSLHRTYNSRPREGKQVFSRDHTVCMSTAGTVGRMAGTLLKSKFPDASQGPTL